jgi:hypothetical protein
MAQGSKEWRALSNEVMNPQVPQKVRNFYIFSPACSINSLTLPCQNCYSIKETDQVCEQNGCCYQVPVLIRICGRNKSSVS